MTYSWSVNLIYIFVCCYYFSPFVNSFDRDTNSMQIQYSYCFEIESNIQWVADRIKYKEVEKEKLNDKWADGVCAFDILHQVVDLKVSFLLCFFPFPLLILHPSNYSPFFSSFSSFFYFKTDFVIEMNLVCGLPLKSKHY